MGRADQSHSWTADLDVARLVAALIDGDDDADWGRAWHVPTDAPASMAEVCRIAAGIAGTEFVGPRPLPRAVVSAGGVVSPLLRALWETRHQFERPFVLDSSAAQDRFGLRPTPLATALELTIGALRRADAEQAAADERQEAGVPR